MRHHLKKLIVAISLALLLLWTQGSAQTIDLEGHVPHFQWRTLPDGQRWIYDGKMPVGQFFAGYRHDQSTNGIARPISLHNLRLLPGGPLFIAKDEGCGPLCLSWRKHLIFYMQIDELKVNDEDPGRLTLYVKSHDVGLRKDQADQAAYQPNNVVEQSWLELTYDPVLPSYVFDVRTRSTIQPGRERAMIRRDFGGLEFADILPADCNVPLAKKRYHDYVYEGRDGISYRLPHNKHKGPEKRGILYTSNGTMAFLLEREYNPVVKLVGDTGLNSYSEICHAMYDVHFKFSKAKQDQLLAAGKPLDVHFKVYAIGEEAGRKMLDRSVWDPKLKKPAANQDSLPRRGPVRKEPVDYVNPLIDSAKSRWIFFSSACRPFGMVNLSPDTDTKGWWNSGYCYHTGSICGLNHSHAWQLSGPSVMPLTGPVKLAAGSDFCRSKFRHDSEVVQPGYHALTLEKYGVRVELTSTDRVGMHRYTFPKSEQSGVLFNLGTGSGPSPVAAGMARRVDDRRIEGYVTDGPTLRRPKPCTYYFVTEFDTPFESLIGWADGKELGEVEQVSGKDTKAIVRFTTREKQMIQLKVGLSYVSVEQARRNLRAELSHWDFDRVRRESRDIWNQWLGKIEVEGGSEAQRTKFYTDLWHVLLGRRLTSDVNGKYLDQTGPKPVIRQIPLGPDGLPRHHHYNSDAFWNTFWNINQVWGMAYPDVTRQFVNFLVDMYHDGGLISRGPCAHNYTWVMVASHSTPLIVGAYMKGIRGFDVQAAYAGMRKNAFPGGAMGHGHYEHNSAKRGGIEEYIKYGYIPIDGRPKGWITEGAAGTLEYAYDDWCLAQMAKRLGKSDDYKLFMRRAGNYRNLFDSRTGFMRPRNRDGSWQTPFDPLDSKDRAWCEGTAWQYTWFVPHDVQGLVDLMGGRDAFNKKLNEAFEKSVDKDFRSTYVNYGNQPSIEMAHLFNYSGAPWLTQKWVREVKQRTFGGITPDTGYGGDEDQGQAGGLGVMMAIGLFQLRGGAAVDPIYEITSPIFDRITIHLDSRYYPGRKFTIITRNNSAKNKYIQSATLDGRPLDRPWFYHRQLVDGGTLELQLGPTPATTLCASASCSFY